MKGVFMRYILGISALFLAGALSAFAAVDPALLALVPPGAKLVSGVQLDQARSSEFGQYLLNRIHTDDDCFQKFTEETGFDPRHDLDDGSRRRQCPPGICYPRAWHVRSKPDRGKSESQRRGGPNLSRDRHDSR
jgi:hypothetical protein